MTVYWRDCDRKAVLGHFIDQHELAIDTETTGIEEHDRLFFCTISSGELTLCLEYPDLVDLDALFKDTTKIWHIQNAKFDMRMLENAGVRLEGRVSELQVMARLVRNDHQKYSLESQAKRAGMEKLDLAKEEIKKHKLYETRTTRLGEKVKTPRFDLIDRNILGVYAAHDAYVTFKLSQLYKSQFTEEQGNHWRVWSNEVDLTKVCYAMERRGVAVNVPKTMAARAREIERRLGLVERFKAVTGLEFVDSAKVLQGVFAARGYTIHTTEKGSPSFTADVLESYGDDEVAQLVLGIRDSTKLVSTYFDNFIDLYVDRGGVPTIHPQMWPGGTRTGRFSYSAPNFQNLSRDEDVKAGDPKVVVRECLMPRKGNVFVSVDFSAMEYMVMLAYANEKSLIAKVMDGADVHQATADLIGIPRQSAKTLNFGVLYGAGAAKIAEMLKVSLREAQNFKDMYFARLPRVERLIDEVIRRGHSRGFIYNWFGRRLYADRDFCYALPNHLIQSSCADVVKVAMVRLGPAAGMVLQIHDELVFELPEGDFESKVREYRKIMEDAFPEMNGIKLRTSASFSRVSFAKKDLEDLDA